MVRIEPFQALRPRPDAVQSVAAPPYDVVSVQEARRLIAGNPDSFLHVTRPDALLPEGMDPTSDEAYARGRQALDRLVGEGILVQEGEPSLYLYRLRRGERTQTGVAGLAQVEDYRSGVIRRHELTHRTKEDDRTRHAQVVGAHVGPVFMAVRDEASLSRLLEAHTRAAPLYRFTAADGVEHTLWRAPETEPYREAFAGMEAAYIADGHHRAASAARVGEPGFLAVFFSASELTVLPYHRVVRDLGGLTPGGFLAALADVGQVTEGAGPDPLPPDQCALFLERRWHTLQFKPDPTEADDPVRSLAYDRLQRKVFEALLGVGDPRTDPRVTCVGGSRGRDALEAAVEAGEAALAVAMPPTRIEDVFRVADAGAIMPPKSTWFEPKLMSGLLVNRFR